jgi:hypothetical protein
MGHWVVGFIYIPTFSLYVYIYRNSFSYNSNFFHTSVSSQLPGTVPGGFFRQGIFIWKFSTSESAKPVVIHKVNYSNNVDSFKILTFFL